MTSPKIDAYADRDTISGEWKSLPTTESQAVATDSATSSVRADSPNSVATTSSTPSTPKKKKLRRAKQRQLPPSRVDTPLSAAVTADDVPMASLPLLICSLGNPGAAYSNTLHSAGHNVVAALATLLQAGQFTKDRSYGNGTLTRSYDPEIPWTLWQSPTFMNESGKGVNAAYRTWARENNMQGRLVVVHDELEKPLGSVTIRDKEGLSARGHNGLKSCLASLGGVKFVRVGVGIGRPVSREPNDVAKYVLKKMTPVERQKVEGAAEDVLNKLMAIKG
ncbi:peptidyl-tRNA hydrolase [Aureobasidium sp. EXF-8845]|nr:peptidyl-tRNA hydrolase [Aureobasidium sp. EXF-8845]